MSADSRFFCRFGSGQSNERREKPQRRNASYDHIGIDRRKLSDYEYLFPDMRNIVDHYEPISWAAEKGITTGLNDGTGRFGVSQSCTREQCVTFLHRAAGTPEPTGSIEFTDSPSGKYYYKAIKWAAGKGITVGLNDGTGRFGVGQKCTRGMLVTFLYRFAMSE